MPQAVEAMTGSGTWRCHAHARAHPWSASIPLGVCTRPSLRRWWTAFLHRVSVVPNRRVISKADLVEALDDTLYTLREQRGAHI
jgi:hypothetical protein